MAEQIWTCKIGADLGGLSLPPGADGQMRQAVEEAFRRLTGLDADFTFSGWGGELSEPERAVVEDREPSDEHYREWLARQPEPAAPQQGQESPRG